MKIFMEKSLWILAIIIVSLVIIVAIAALLHNSMPKNYDKGQELNSACLELIKNGCDETTVSINSKSFEDICKENGLTIDKCKNYCGCK